MSTGRRYYLILLCLLTWAVLRVAPSALAEGSKEMNNNTGDRTYLEYRSDNTAGSSVPRKTIIYAYANSGETISLGSSASGMGSGTIGAGLGAIIWYAPDGTIGTNTSTTIGRINTIAQEFAGPLPNAGGYNPTNLTVGVGQTGVWRVDFVSTQIGVDVAPGAANPANSTAWTQATNVQYVAAWDVTVHSGNTNTPAVLGRVYTTQIAMNMGNGGRLLRSIVYFLTKDGYQYQCDLNGIDPYGFNFFADNNGFEAGGVGTGSSYKSVALAVNDVQNPNAADTASEITHKLFFNPPAIGLPSSASSFSGTEWLLVPPVSAPTISSTLFVGVDGTTNQVGAGLGGTFTFTASGAGVYIIALDLNNNGSFTDAVDRVLEGPASFGTNTVFWDGLDGNGNPAPRSGGVGFLASASLADGVVHFPFLDVENAPTGFKITRQNGAGSPSTTIFYNDTGLGGPKYLPPTGVDSAAGAHAWTGNFGNNNGIDTWTFVIGNAISNSLIIKVADLQVVSKSISPTVVAPTSNVTYTVVIKNNGPDTVQLGHFVEKFPPGLTNLVLNSSVFTLAGSITSSSWSNNIYDAIVSMVSNSVGTLTFSGAAAPGLGSILTNVAQFLSYNDVGDPNDPARVGAGNNNQTNITAVTFAVNGTVYNDANFNGTMDGGETGTNLNLYAKLIPTNAPGAAVQAVLVDNSGNYSLTTTNAGGYIVILDNNNTLSDVAPFLPPGWLGTQAPGQTINGITLTASNVTGQNFGLYNGSYLVLGKSASPAVVSGLSNTLFSITITNTSSISNALVTIVDNLPTNVATSAGLSYSNGTSLFNGSPIGNPVIVSVTNLTWNGPFSIPGNSVATLTFRARIPTNSPVAYTNKVYATIGTTQIDSTTNTTDNVPAQTTVLDGIYADLVAAKSGPANVTNGVTFNYTVAVTNTGPSTATGINLTDTLPPGVSFNSATGGGTNLTGVVGWPAFSLTVNTFSNFTVSVTSTNAGILTNRAQVASAVADPNLANNTNQVYTTASALADLVLVKSGTNTIGASTNITYTLFVTNAGPSIATSVSISDALPTNATYVSSSNSGTNAAGVVGWPLISSLASNAGVTYTVTITPAPTGVMTNTAWVSSSAVVDSNLGNNTNTAITTVTPQADLVTVKTGPATATNGMNFAYSIAVTNNGPSAATGINAIDILPVGVTFVGATGGGTNANGTIGWPAFSLASTTFSNFTVTVTPTNVTGILSNKAVATSPVVVDPSPGNNTNIVTTALTNLADLVTVKVGPVNATNGVNFAYSISVTNNGPSGASGINAIDILPAGVTFVGATGGGTNANGTIGWPAFTLASTTFSNFTVTVTPTNVTGILSNKAVATSPVVVDPSPGNNTNIVTTTLTNLADLVTVKVGPANATNGVNFAYSISVTNNGPSGASGINAIDILPAGVTFVGASGGGTNANGTIGWPAFSLASTTFSNFTVTVTPTNVTGILSNTAVATSPVVVDPSPGNNTNIVTTTLTNLADLVAVKVGPATATNGVNFAYSIAVTNNGPSTATGINAIDILPVGVTFVSASSGGTNANGTIGWPAFSLTSSTFSNFTVTVTPTNVTGILSNKAVATSPVVVDPSPGNNTNIVSTTLTNLADLVTVKVGPANATNGVNFAYSIAVTNNGPSTATGINAIDILPVGVTFVGASGGGTNANGTIGWPAFSLASTTFSNFTVTVTPTNVTGILSNTAVATSPVVVDPSPGNNTNIVTTTLTNLADVVTVKVGPANATNGVNFAYTIAVTNNGPSTATGINAKDILPVGVTFVGATGGGTNLNGTIGWPAFSLASTTFSNFTVTVTPTNATGILTNTAVATSPLTPDPSPGNNTNIVTTTLTNLADVVTVKTGPANATNGVNFAYSIAVTNNGPSAATGINAIDILPAGVTFVGATGGGTNANGTIGWPAFSLASATFSNFTVTVTPTNTAGILTNTAVATSPLTPDPSPGNNTNQVYTTIGGIADLVAAKSGPATVTNGVAFAYTVAVTNNGPSATTGINLTDTLPAGVAFNSATGGGTNLNGVVGWPAFSLANSTFSNFTVSVTSTNAGILTNRAQVASVFTDPNLANNTNQVYTTASALADVVAVKVGPAVATNGVNFAYSIAVTNNGPSTAAGINAVDILPVGVTFVSASGGGTNANGAIGWPAFSLASTTFSNFTVTVTPTNVTGILTNTAVATSPLTPDPSPGNNTNVVTTTLTNLADVVTVKTGPANATNGVNFAYSIAVTNNGPSTAAGINAVDLLPVGVTFVGATGGGTNANGTIGWPAFSLASTTYSNFTVTVTPTNTTGILTNTAVATSPLTPDPSPGNNTNQVYTTMGGIADLVAVKVGPATATNGVSFAYSIAVTNNGPSTATGINAIDILPTGVTFVSANGGGTNANGTIGWPAFSLASTTFSNFTVTVTPTNVTGILTNTAVATSSLITDPSPGNNTNVVTTTLTNLADLVAVKSGPANATNGVAFNYAVAVTNNGPSLATGINLSDTLPVGVTFNSATGGGTNLNGVVGWPSFSLANSAFSNFTVSVTATNSGILTNQAQVASAVADNNLANNTNQVYTTVGGVADLVAVKVGPATATNNVTFTYSISVTNNGPSSAGGINAIDILPAGVTFVGATGGGTNANGTVGWPVFSLASTTFSNFTVTVTPTNLTGILSNTAVATSSLITDPSPGNNTNIVTTTLTNLADVVTVKTGPANVTNGVNFAYSIAVTNNGPSTATGINAIDILPVGVTFVGASGGGTNANGAIGWPAFSLASTTFSNFTVTVTPTTATGILTNTAVATSPLTPDPSPGNNTNQVYTTVGGVADLVAAKSGPANATNGVAFTYTVAVTNNGPSTATGINLTDTLPGGISLGPISGGGTNANGVVGWPAFSLALNGVSNFTVSVTATNSGVLTNQAQVGSAAVTDPNLANNTNQVITPMTSVADLAITKTGAPSWPAVSNLVYTITLTNLGPSAATSVVVTDALPATVTFVGASASGAHSGNFVAWGPIATFAAGAASNFTVTVTTPVAGVLTNVAAGGAATADPTPANNDGTAAGAKVITTLAGGVTVSGFVYNDVNRNATKDGSETGSGLTLYAKLFNGTLTNVVSVNSGSGSYAFSNTVSGTYTIVVSTNNSLTDVTGSLPVSWVGTEITNQTRANVAVATADVPSQNFGLYNGIRLSGVVFADTGTGAGTPNDGIRNGNESGIPGVTVKLTDNSGGTVYDTTTTDGGGTYTLYVPAGATTVKVVETNLTGYVSTGVSLGNTLGSYDRPSDTITFANVAGTTYAGVNFGDVPVNQFLPDNQQTALPGSTIVYAHTFIAGSGGQVTFTVTNIPSPNTPGWTSTLYVDSNCNGKFDANEPLLTNAVTVLTGQQLCILVKEFVPAGAAQNAQDLATVTATFSYTNATPVLQATVVHNDLTTVGNPTTAGLTLVKAVDKAAALPGEILTYTLIYQNTGSGNLTNVVIADATPAYCTFVNATTGPLPPNLTGVTLTVPASNSVGAIRWQFIGVLTPAGSGTNAFSVQIVQ